MAFGTFDGLHLGHEAYLREARALGDYLIAVVARDETVKKIKGHAPEHTERQRKKMLEESGLADKVAVGSATDKYEIIRTYRPQVIALGYDQFVFSYRLGKFLIDEKIDARVVRMQPFKPNIFKTSLLRAEASLP